MKKFLALVVIPLLFLISCSDDDSNMVAIEETVFPDIIGTWEWVETTGGASDVLESPSITGVTRDIVITETSFIFYINDEFFADREYSFALETSVVTGQEEFIVTFLDDNFKDVVQKDGDIIVFTDDCEGCFVSVYQLKD